MPTIHQNLADIITRLGRPGSLDGSIVEECERLALQAPSMALVWTVLGDALLRTDDTDTAKVAYSKALMIDRDSLGARVGLSRAYRLSGDIDQAIAELDVAVARSPDNVGLKIMLGRTLGFAGRLEDALSVLREAVELQPANAAYRCILAVWLERAGARHEAVSQWEQVARLKPDSKLALIAKSALSRDSV